MRCCDYIDVPCTTKQLCLSEPLLSVPVADHLSDFETVRARRRMYRIAFLLQVGLIFWALRLELQAVFACWGSMRSGQGFPACGLYGVPHAVLLGAGFFFSLASLPLFFYLLSLHTYLLATNQTTYEVIKGAKLGYLAPHFQGRSACATRYHLPGDLHTLWWDEIRGRGPPKPFSRGVWKNVWAQISAAWPRQYVTSSP